MRFAITTASVTVFALIANTVPSYSADFLFGLNGQFDNPNELTFTQSSLTGIGQETANLSELPDAQFSVLIPSPANYVPESHFLVYTNSYGASFNFNNGNLIGINLTTSDSNYGTFYTHTGSVTASLTGTLTLTGDQYQERFTGYITYDGTYTTNYNNTLVSSGKIDFKTITPIDGSLPVPEPLNILGATTGLALFGTVSRAHKRRKNTL